MARFADARCWHVEQHNLYIDLTSYLVTVPTGDVAVSALEGETRGLVVVESRWLPARRIMTAGTVGGIFAGCELAGVRVLVASEALL